MRRSTAAKGCTSLRTRTESLTSFSSAATPSIDRPRRPVDRAVPLTYALEGAHPAGPCSPQRSQRGAGGGSSPPKGGPLPPRGEAMADESTAVVWRVPSPHAGRVLTLRTALIKNGLFLLQVL